MTKFIFIVVIILQITACSSRQTIKQKDETPPLSLYIKDTLPNQNIIFRPNYTLTQNDSAEIKLDFFDTIPETIQYSRLTYTYDTTKLDSTKYIFLGTIGDFAIMKINKRDTYLRKEYDKCILLGDDNYKEVYSGNGYTAVLVHKVIKHNDGKTYEKGILELNNSKYRISINVHGGYRL